jgi:AbrB family looped-hinge helix DNA binding protein
LAKELVMKISQKGQVTIPIEIRKKMGLLPNTEVEFVISGQSVVLKKSPQTRRRGSELIATMRGRATRRMTTDQIMALTRRA